MKKPTHFLVSKRKGLQLLKLLYYITHVHIIINKVWHLLLFFIFSTILLLYLYTLYTPQECV